MQEDLKKIENYLGGQRILGRNLDDLDSVSHLIEDGLPNSSLRHFAHTLRIATHELVYIVGWLQSPRATGVLQQKKGSNAHKVSFRRSRESKFREHKILLSSPRKERKRNCTSSADHRMIVNSVHPVRAEYNYTVCDYKLDSEKSDLLFRAGALAVRAEEILGSQENMLTWIKHPNKNLEGKTPLEMTKNSVSYNVVNELLDKIEYGVGY